MKYLILIALLFLANGCASTPAWEPDQRYVDSCYTFNNAESCRRLAFQFGQKANDTQAGLVLLERACMLGSELGCDNLKYIRAAIAQQKEEFQTKQQALGDMSNTLLQLGDRWGARPVQRTYVPQCVTAPSTNVDGSVSFRTNCQ